MTVQNVNNKQATTTLNEPSNITAGTTAIDVDDNYATAGFPEAPFAVLIDSELVLVTSTGTGTDWTIERGYGGTTAATHNDGATLSYKLTAEWFNAVVNGHIITSSGTSVAQRPKLNFDSNFTVTDGALSDDYWTVLDSHSPLFSLTLQDNKNDRLSLVTFTENGAPTYNDDTAPTVDSSSSAYFDGTGDQLTLAGASAYNTDITVIMWYKGTDVGGDDNLNNLGVNLFACNTGSTVKRWIIGIDSNGYLKATAGNSMAAGATSTSVINDDAWHMLAATISSVSGVTLVGYLDGSSIGSGTDSAGAGNPQLQIMGPGRSTGGLGIGNVAEVSIIPSVLTSGDISALWAARNVSSTETLTTISAALAADVDKFRGKGYTNSTLDASYDDKIQVYWTGTDWSTRNGWLTSGSTYSIDYRYSWGAGVGGWVRIDADEAVEGAILRYWFIVGTNADGPATFEGIEVEYSDNDSSWTSHYSITGLSSIHNELKAIACFDIDVSEAGAHRYWRVTVENAVALNWMFPVAIQLL